MPTTDALILARLRSVLRVRDLEEEMALRARTCREMGLAEDPAAFTPQTNVLLAPQSATGGRFLANRLAQTIDAKIAVQPLAGLLARIEGQKKLDVLVIEADANDPALDLHYLSDLRCRAETRHASIILCLPEGAEMAAAMALDLGASDVIVGQTDTQYLSARIAQQLHHQQNIRQLRAQVNDGLKLAVVDPLTGLYNRRYALRHLERLAERALHTGRALAVMVVDIDRFKGVNDAFGHQNGDRVIDGVAQALKGNLRAADLVSRYGGEEFLIAMPDTSVEEAYTAAERLCALVGAMPIGLEDGQTTKVTLSIGVTVRVPEDVAPNLAVQSMIKDADSALYKAKSSGRNQVTLREQAA